MKRTIVMLVLALLALQAAAADTYSLVDEKYLPLRVINDPLDHENQPITRYSYEQLDRFLRESPNFRRWNDAKRVCETMKVMFGRASPVCARLPVRTYRPPEPDVYVLPTTSVGDSAVSTGKVTFEIAPPRRSRPAYGRVVHVRPPYPTYPRVWYPWG